MRFSVTARSPMGIYIFLVTNVMDINVHFSPISLECD